MRALIGAALLCAAGAAHADWTDYLQARDLDGNGTADAYFDAALGVTFLGDANYAATVGYLVGVKHGAQFLPRVYPDGYISKTESLEWTEAGITIGQGQLAQRGHPCRRLLSLRREAGHRTQCAVQATGRRGRAVHQRAGRRKLLPDG